MKTFALITFLTAAAVGGGVAVAQKQPAPAPTAQAAPAATTGMGPGMMGGGMMGGGMMGGGAMGGGMMGGGMMGCGMMEGTGVKMDVKKIDKGVTVTLTSTDPQVVTRLQKRWEGMRLMHESMVP